MHVQYMYILYRYMYLLVADNLYVSHYPSSQGWASGVLFLCALNVFVILMCAFVCWFGVSVGNFLSSLSTHVYIFSLLVCMYSNCTVTLFCQVFFIDHDHCVTSFIDPRLPLPDHEFTYTTSSPSTTRPQQEIRFGEEVNM